MQNQSPAGGTVGVGAVRGAFNLKNSVIDADGADNKRITQIFFGCPPLVEPHLVGEGKESASI